MNSFLGSKPIQRLKKIAAAIGVVMVIGGIGEASSGKAQGVASAILGAVFIAGYWLIPSPEKAAERQAHRAANKVQAQARSEAATLDRENAAHDTEMASREAQMRADPALLQQAYREEIAAYGNQVTIGLLPETEQFGHSFDHHRRVKVPADQHVLALGPPRSGKTSTIIVPSILTTDRPTVSTSTKEEILTLTAGARQQLGRIWLFDPSDSVEGLPGVTRIRWSPVQAAKSWDEAQPAGLLLLEAARDTSSGGVQNEGYWRERAGAMLGPLLLAANVSGGSMRQVMIWVNQRSLEEPMNILHRADAEMAYSVLVGLERSEQKELSGIFSTLASALSAYARDAVLRSTDEPNFDPQSFPTSTDTVYLCSPGDDQKVLAPLMVLFLDGLRREIYKAHRRGQMPRPALFMLDELANIAPIPTFPNILSEAASQGLQIVACLQDLSQARKIWDEAGEGLLTMFATKLVFSGINDRQTLELLSKIAGEYDEHVTVSNESWGQSESSGGFGANSSGTSYTRGVSEQVLRKERLPVSDIARQRSGTVLWFAPQGFISLNQNSWYQDGFLTFLVDETRGTLAAPTAESVGVAATPAAPEAPPAADSGPA